MCFFDLPFMPRSVYVIAMIPMLAGDTR